jgi:hypothetical protein
LDQREKLNKRTKIIFAKNKKIKINDIKSDSGIFIFQAFKKKGKA